MAGDLTRITINLTPRGAAALKAMTDRVGEDRTTVINEALRLYALAGDVCVEDRTRSVTIRRADGSTERVGIL